MPSSRGWRDPEGGRTGEPSPLGEVVAGLLGQRAFSSGVALGRLAREWEEVVGPRLAKVSAPARLEAGTLVIRTTSGAWGAQVRFLSREIAERANQALRMPEVKRVRVVVFEDGSDAPKPL